MPDDGGVLDALLESAHVALVGVDHEGVINRWSKGASSLFGWTAAEAIGQPLTMLAPPEQLSDLIRMRDEVLSQGQELSPVETFRRSKPGEKVAVHVQVLPLRDGQREPVGALALYHDIRPAGLVSTALSDSEQELQARFQRSPVPQSRLSLDARVLAANDAMCALLGLPMDALIGADGLALLHEDDRGAVALALGEVASGEQTHIQLEARLLTADGVRSTVLNGTAVRQQSGQAVLAVSAQDVTDLRAAEEAVRVQAARFEAVLSTLPVGVFAYDASGRCTFSRGAVLDVFGLQQDELVGADLRELYADQPAGLDALRQSLTGQAATATIEMGGRTLAASCHPQYDDEGELVGGVGICIDVTERTRAEREVRDNEAKLRSLLQYASDVAFVVGDEGTISYVSPAVRLQLGYEEDQLVGRTAVDLDHPEDRELVLGAWRAVRAQPGATAACECRMRHADGSWVWTEQIFTNLLDDPVIRGVVVNVRETTARRRVEEDLRRLALQDPLTGLANRTLLLDRLRQAMNRERRSESRTGLIALDVVGMHALNQSLGQQGGDEVLREVAQRLQVAVRDSDSLARIGGDDFVVLVEGVASAEDLRARMATLLEVVDEPVLVAQESVEVRLRAGSAVTPAPDAGALLARAERSVRSAPADEPAEDGAEREQVAELRSAIAAGQLQLHFQPVIELATDRVAGVEALVRWQHPTRGLVPPSEFIPLAERSGAVIELGEWVLLAACTRLAEWTRSGRDWSVGVNLSPRQLVGTDFPAVVSRVLSETGAAAERLVIEVTESTLMDDPDAPAVLNALRLMGVRLALDDFGTGYSSLTYLRRFTVDSIKIDRSFVSGLGRDPDDDAIVASIVSLAGAVGKLVVAEGVETIGQLQVLRDMGVPQAQGFLWTRPLPPDQLEGWLVDRPQLRVAPEARPKPARTAGPATVVVPGSDESQILELHLQGASLHTVAAALNAQGRRTSDGRRWTTTTVARVVADLVRTSSAAEPVPEDAR